jgi:hypothetical protein
MSEWVPLTGGTGSLQIRVSYKPNQVGSLLLRKLTLL